MIKITNFSKYYGKHLGVKDISFTVNKGEIYGFIGQNGAGKTTTIRALLNLIFKTNGSLKIDGLDVEKETKQIKSFTSYVPSEVEYYQGSRVSDIFNLSKSLTTRNVDVDKLCKYFDLDQNRFIKELSLGNKKKVSLIQALIKNPQVIILDEPTSGLDPIIQERLFTLLKQKQKEGLTVFLSSHNLREVEKYCDKVLIVKNGEVIDVFDLNEKRKTTSLKVIYKEKNKPAKTIITEENVNTIINNLARKDLESIEILKPSLEEEFMKYYQED